MDYEIYKTKPLLKKKILLSGSNGFIGSSFYKYFYKSFEIIRIKINYNSKNFKNEFFENLPDKQIDYYFHFSFEKNRFNRKYDFININSIPVIIESLKIKYNKIIIFYISTSNVLLLNYYDKYTHTKAIVENLLSNINDVSIIRFPLVRFNKKYGDEKKFEKLINFFPFFSLIPYKGSRINYISLENLMLEFEKILNLEIRKTYNINSNNYIHLYNIAENLAKKRKFYINIDNKLSIFLKYISPAFLSVDYEVYLKNKK